MSYILGIESSCDETAASVLKDGTNVLSNVIASQIDIHKEYGGVVPEIASRAHLENIDKVVDKAIKDANISYNDLDAVAVTNGPGLVGTLFVGVSFAKALAFSLNIPLIGVDHIMAHISVNKIENNVKDKYIALVMSGGHTHIIYFENNNSKLIGKTVDDACGEAYDKIARVVGLSYPGGPNVERVAKLGNESINFPIPKTIGKYDFSFSGLKSSVINYVNTKKMKNEVISIEDICASFQKSVAMSLVEKTKLALIDYNVDQLLLAGGVASNKYIRSKMEEMCKKEKIELCYPSGIYCTDNAVMVARLGYEKFIEKKYDNLDLNVYSRIKY